ncbi:MAG: DUF6600 domain-containing protein [Acidobacteriota bacterium]
MYSRQKGLWAVLLLAPMVFSFTGISQTPEDDEPEVKARVARVTVVTGDVQIKRTGVTDWERVKPDLPVVEGDEIATDANSRVEIQLNTGGHVRLDQNSYLQVLTLKDAGIALSVPRGTMSLRLLDFDKEKSFLEIDAPKTTIAVQKAGIYRIDAGAEDSRQIRVSVMESGEARVYSGNSGFTVKNGRSSLINIDGAQEGEWETTDASRYADDFDSWALDRDVAIAKRLKDAYYDKYYDRDIYGAEDLNDSGEWIHTNRYGYVWRPYSAATSRYSDWSPYRYGEWRWIPPFGWTWVNDEPWGWATYHHGRWLFDDGYWVWSPYGYYRGHRSWWSPALVVITIFNDNFCWYPLPYNYAYYDYNSYYYGGGGRRHGHHNGQWPGSQNPNPGPHPSPTPGGGGQIWGPGRMGSMPFYQVPLGGVVTTPGSSFGTGKGDIRKAPPEVAKGVLEKNPDDDKTIPRLPKFGDISGKVGGTIRVEKPILARLETKPSMGATERKQGKPLDDDLRSTRVLGKRPPPPAQPDPGTGQPPRVDRGGKKLPDTGAVGRPVKLPDSDTSPVRSIPKVDDSDGSKGETPKAQTPRDDTPRRSVEPRIERPKREEPKYSPPPNQAQPRNDPPKREEPRYTQPPRQEQPRNEPPKQEQPKSSPPPQREQPRNDPPKRDEPSRSQPEPSKKKDGRR